MFCEVQLIHQKILELKFVQHKFYDFSRTSFGKLRNRWLFVLFNTGLDDLKRDQKFKEVRTC